MLIYGKNVLFEINKKRIKNVYIARDEYINYLEENKIKYRLVDNKYLDKMVNGVHQGIVLDIHEYEYKTMEDVVSDKVLVLDHIEDPHNFGAIIRTAACSGFTDIIIAKDRSVKVNETVIKVSTGMLEKVNVIMVTNLASAINKLKKDNYFVYAADMHGDNYSTVNYDGKKVLVIGNEGKGVSKLILNIVDVTVSIPMEDGTDSLNASVAAGILMFEMRK